MKAIYLCLVVLFVISCSTNKITDQDLKLIIEKSLTHSIQQHKNLANSITDTLLPRTMENGKVKQVNIYDWTSGFFPASLWYLYEYSEDQQVFKLAKHYTHLLEPLQNFTHTHDLGFMVYCPYSKAFDVTQDSAYLDVIIKASKSLMTRYNPTLELIRSWDDPYWQYPVIIDNMMNLEMLTQATAISGDSSFYHAAVSHSNKTLAHHFREDNSSFHLVSYDTISGTCIKKQTVQGFADESAWSRGQAWGLYGYISMFCETGDAAYLSKAIAIADFMMNHNNMPADGIAYWDFDAPDIPNTPRDVAAAAIMASGLIEVDNYVADKQYLNFAKKIIISLSDEPYLAKSGSNHGFVLKHATGSLPGNSEIDVPLIYADYYYIEAMVRLLATFENDIDL